jgi:hypothetical protein
METHFHAVNRQLRQHVDVDGFDHLLPQSAAANVGLIRGHNQKKAGGLERGQRAGNFRKNLELGQISRRIWLGLALQRAIDDPVAIQENGARARFFSSRREEALTCGLRLLFSWHYANDE